MAARQQQPALHTAGIGALCFCLGAAAAVAASRWAFAAPAASPPPPAPAPPPRAAAGAAARRSDEEEVKRLQEQIQAERMGRVRAEKALRESVNRAVAEEGGGGGGGGGGGYPLLPIGHISSPCRGRWGTPRQGMLAPDARAHVVFNPAIPATALQGLAEYSHVFVLFLFHENSNMHKMAKPGRAEGLPAQTRAQRAAGRRAGGGAGGAAPAAGEEEEGGEEGTLTRLLRERHFSALIEPPAMKGQRTGVLSTRSPHRPNAIGLSLCRLVAVHDQPSGQRMLVLAGCDLLAGTPVVDVKPYAPYDCPVCLGGLVGVAPSAPRAPQQPHFAPARDLPAALRNLADGADLVGPAAYALRGPAWVYGTLQDQAGARLPVVWGPGTAEALLAAVREGRTGFYGAREAALLQQHASGSGGAEAGAGAGAEEEEVLAREGRALLLAVSQVLALDIRAVHHGRGGAPSETRGGGAARSAAALASSPAVLRRMGLEGQQDPAAAVAAAVAAAADSPAVQYYELLYDVFDLKWTCVEREGGSEGGSGKGFYARVDSVGYAALPSKGGD